MNDYLTKDRFDFISRNLLEFSLSDYAEDINHEELCRQIFRTNYSTDFSTLVHFIQSEPNELNKHFLKWILLVQLCTNTYKNEGPISVGVLWDFCYSVLCFFKNSKDSVSVGSQGFASIEIFRWEEKEHRKILRLHIWNDEIKDSHKQLYSVHSHRYHGQSIVLTGKLINTRYDVKQSESKSDFSLYQIAWNQELKGKENYGWKSSLKPYLKNVSIKANAKETYSKGDRYFIKPSEFHSSETESKVTASIFFFDSKLGALNDSFVVGEVDQTEPRFNYKEFNLLHLLREVNEAIKLDSLMQTTLAKVWLRKMHILEHAHRIESRQFGRLAQILEWGIVILPSFAVAFSVYKSKLQDNESVLLLAFLAGLTAFLGALLRFMNPRLKSDIHMTNSQEFEKLRHLLEKTIIFNSQNLQENSLEIVRKKWSKLTLHNVREENFKTASYWIDQMNIYPKTINFHEK